MFLQQIHLFDIDLGQRGREVQYVCIEVVLDSVHVRSSFGTVAENLGQLSV
jgi:hypothetical protein